MVSVFIAAMRNTLARLSQTEAGEWQMMVVAIEVLTGAVANEDRDRQLMDACQGRRKER